MTTLFEWHKSVRRDDPDTSKDAAKSAKSLASKHHEIILGVLRASTQPLAAEEIADRTDTLNHVHIGKRLIELERGQLVVKTDEKHTNISGRQAYRYRAVVEITP